MRTLAEREESAENHRGVRSAAGAGVTSFTEGAFGSLLAPFFGGTRSGRIATLAPG